MSDVETTAAEVKKAREALQAAEQRHADNVRAQAPPKHVREMTDDERQAAARKLGITGRV